MSGAGTPLYDETACRLRPSPAPRSRGRHHLQDYDTPTMELPIVGKHGDDDADGITNAADPDWRPDQRDDDAHGDEACDQPQAQADRWVGVTRDPEVLERVMIDG